MRLNNFLFITIFLLLVSSACFVSASITASIGNSRMVLRPSFGDTVQKSILVRNVNNVSVDINLTVEGDLKDYVHLNEDHFSLAPGEEKDAGFTIKAAKSGLTETRINVIYNNPGPEGGGVVLSAAIILVVNNSTDSQETNLDNFSQNNATQVINQTKTTSQDINKTTDKITNSSKSNKLLLIILASSLVLVVILILLLLYSKKMAGEKGRKLNRKASLDE